MCEKLFFHKVLEILIVTMGRYWLVHDSTRVSMGQCGLLLGQYEAELVDT